MLPLGAVYRDLSDFIRNKQATTPSQPSGPLADVPIPNPNPRETDRRTSTETETERPKPKQKQQEPVAMLEPSTAGCLEGDGVSGLCAVVPHLPLSLSLLA